MGEVVVGVGEGARPPAGGFMGLGLGMEVEEAGASTHRRLVEGPDPRREALAYRPTGMAVAGEAEDVIAAMRPSLWSSIISGIKRCDVKRTLAVRTKGAVHWC